MSEKNKLSVVLALLIMGLVLGTATDASTWPGIAIVATIIIGITIATNRSQKNKT